MQKQHEKWLKELTCLPTAAGREGQVVKWVERWAKRRAGVTLTRDGYGNLTLKKKGARSKRPVYFTAHMDHPAFVVHEAEGTRVEAHFRGGVHADYFVGTRVRFWRRGKEVVQGVVRAHVPRGGGVWYGRCEVELDEAVALGQGDVGTWALGEGQEKKGWWWAPACDDLGGLAAALSAFDVCLKQEEAGDVRVLLTRAEEIGFVGAIAAAKGGTVPSEARLVCLECSATQPEAPIGAGPIVRVGDKTSTFTPALTYAVSQLAAGLAKQDASFKWQRKLMPGGTCEASAFHALGYTATCCCLPLGHYHNMDTQAKQIGLEHIALSDYHGLIRLLVAVGQGLGQAMQSAGFEQVVTGLLRERRGVLDEAM